MKKRVASLVAAAGAAAAPHAAADFRFHGLVRSDTDAPIVLSVELPSRAARAYEYGSIRIELTTPGWPASQSGTQVRLFRAVEGEYRLLHETSDLSAREHQRSFAYVLCGLEVRYLRPSPSTLPECR